MSISHFQQISLGLEALTVLELEELMTQILRLRRQKLTTVLSETETDLLRKINAELPAVIQKRYNFLLKKRKSENISMQEYEELLELTAFQEAHTNKRLANLIELAKIRNQSLDEVLNVLQIKPRLNVI